MENYIHRGPKSLASQKKAIKIDFRKQKKRWTEEEDKILMANFKKMTYSEIATKLSGRTKNMVRERARTLKLAG